MIMLVSIQHTLRQIIMSIIKIPAREYIEVRKK